MPEDNDLLEQLHQHDKRLLKKSRRKMILFFAAFLLAFVLFLERQGELLFVLDLSKFSDPVEAPSTLALFFQLLTLLVLLGIFAYGLWFYHLYKKQKAVVDAGIPEETNETYEKHYEFFDLITVIPVFVLFLIVLNGYFFAHAVVDGQSMNPTYCDGDVVIVSYHTDIGKDDIVIVVPNDVPFIKRLIAGPGDELIVDEDGVFVNGQLIEDTIRSGYIPYDGTIPENRYFVLGDNRNASNDSRYVGLIEEEDMLGEVIFSVTHGSCPIGG